MRVEAEAHTITNHYQCGREQALRILSP
jgi:hypothetical protein